MSINLRFEILDRLDHPPQGGMGHGAWGIGDWGMGTHSQGLTN